MDFSFDRKIEVNSWIIKSRWFYVGGVFLIGFLTRVVELKKEIENLKKELEKYKPV